MKNVFLSFALICALVISSCKDKTPADKGTETATETSVIEPTETTSSAASIPNFSNAYVQAYVETYESYLEDYKKAVESKDMTAFAALATKGQDLAAKAQEVSGKVTGVDAEKLTAYMTKKAEELQELSKKMTE